MTGPLTPPHDLDAEAAVISAVLLEPERLVEVSGLVNADDFYADANRRIWQAIEAVDRDGGRIDVVTVGTWLREHERLDQIGGTPYLAQILGATPAVAHVAEHARTVAELSYQRRLLNELRTATAEGYHATDALAWGQSVERRIFEASRFDRHGSDDGTLDVVVPETIETIAAKAKGETPRGGRVIKTGLAGLDRELGGGYRAGNKYEIAGRPGMGKSALVLQSVAACGRGGEAAILLSGEMPRDQIATRLLSQESGVIHARLERGIMRADDWGTVMGQVSRLQKLPISIVYAPAMTSGQVRTAVRREMARLRRLYGAALRLGMIAIDHLHIMNGERQRGESEVGELTRLSKANLWLAGEFDCVMVELAQLNRGIESRPDKRPNMSDIRGAGSVEEDAHTILFPFRPAYYDKDRKSEPMDDAAEPDEAEIIIGKQRGGAPGSVPCVFHGQTLRFMGIADASQEDDGCESGDRYP